MIKLSDEIIMQRGSDGEGEQLPGVCAVPAGIAIQSMPQLFSNSGPCRCWRGTHLGKREHKKVSLGLRVPFERHVEFEYEWR